MCHDYMEKYLKLLKPTMSSVQIKRLDEVSKIMKTDSIPIIRRALENHHLMSTNPWAK